MQTETITNQSLMQDFAENTGLLDAGTPHRRYLWTDAFAVCNFLELYRQTADQGYLQLALKLVDQVHQVLGKHRSDSTQQGWLSGLDELAAQQHPTCAGLRIGKPLNERQPDESPDEAREWQQDGQYFHYLTRWMHALDCVARVTRRPLYLQWALELAQAAHAAFTYVPLRPGNEKRMYWKMSIDLSRPLVPLMGQHDPLDGLMTLLHLQTTAQGFADFVRPPALSNAILDLQLMCQGKHWATRDPLGIGGLLLDTLKLFQLSTDGTVDGAPSAVELLQDIEHSQQAFCQQSQMELPAEHRLPFREIGLAIGLQALAAMQDLLARRKEKFEHAEHLRTLLNRLQRYRSFQQNIESFWLQPEHQRSLTWRHHADINSVMLATCLAPASYMGL